MVVQGLRLCLSMQGVLRLCLPMQGVWVQSLVRELKSHMPRGQKNPNIKQKLYCDKVKKL